MMAVADLATRVYNHTWTFDPIFRSMLDQDFYILLMAQLIWKKHPQVNTVYSLKNRTVSIRVAEEIDINQLKLQLDHARTVKLTRGESTWLRGNTFYGKRQIFESSFMDWLEKFSLPEYELHVEDGQVSLSFSGSWLETSFWEIPALSIINELRSRSVLNKLSKFEIDIVYARAKSKLWSKAERLRSLYLSGYEFKISDFGTRRRHSFLFQRWAVQAMQEAIGNNFIGTSNCLMAMQNDLEAIGTNAHSLPMVYAALSRNDQELAQSPYKVLEDWSEMYEGNLRVILPDAFGTSYLLKGEKLSWGSDVTPKWMAQWKGIRPDSLPWKEGAQSSIDFWISNGEDPKQKLVILSDGMDIESIENSVKQFSGQTNISIGWGTNLTNDFKECLPNDSDALKAISLVCKVKSANGRPCVKLSDNPAKAMGEAYEVERYKRVFNYPDIKSTKVEV